MSLRRLYIPFLLSFLIILCAAAFYLPLRRAAMSAAEGMKHSALRALETSTGLQISFEEVDPALLHAIDIRGLDLHDDTGRRIATIQRLRLIFDLPELVLGGFRRIVVRDLLVENAHFDLDDASLSRLERTLNASTDQAGSVVLRSLTGRNLRIDYTNGDVSVSARRVFFQITRRADEEFSLDLESALHLRGPQPLGEARTSLSLSGLVGGDLRSTSLLVRFAPLTTDHFRLAGQTFQLSYDPERFSLVKVQDRTPLDITVDYSFISRRALVSFRADGFSPRSLLRFNSSREDLDHWLATTSLTGSGTMSLSLSGEDVSYGGTISLESSHPVLRESTRFLCDFSGSGDAVRFSRLNASSPLGAVDFQGIVLLPSLRPQGRLRLNDFRFFTPFPITTDLELTTEASTLAILGERLTAGPLVFHRPAGLVRLGYEGMIGSVDLSMDPQSGSGVRAEFSTDPDGDHTVSLELRSIPAGALKSAGAFYHPSLSALSAVVDEAVGELRLDGLLVVSGSADDYLIEAPTLRLSGPSGKDYLAMRGRVDREGFSLAAIDLAWQEYSGSGSLKGRFEPNGLISLQSSVSYLDMIYGFQASLNPEGSLLVRGDNDFQAHFSWRPGGGVDLLMSGDGFPLRLGDRTVSLAFDLNGRFVDPDDWSLNISRFETGPIRLTEKNDLRVELEAVLEPGGGRIGRLALIDRYSSLSGEGSLAYDFGGPSLTAFARLQDIDADERTESYDLRLSILPPGVSLMVLFSRAPLERVGIEGLSGYATGNLEFSRISGQTEWTTALSVEEGRFGADAFLLSAEAAMTGGRLRVSGLEASYLQNRIIDGSAYLDLEAGSLMASADVTNMATGMPILFTADLSASFPPHEAPFSSPSDFTASLDLRRMLFGGEVGQDVSLRMSRTSSGISIESSPGELISGRIHPDSSFDLRVSEPFPVSMRVNGSLAGPNIDARISGIEFSFERLSRFLNIGFIYFLRGRGTGELHIHGLATDPSIDGSLVISDALCRIDIMSEDLKPPPVTLSFDGKVVVMERFSIPTRTGRAAARGVFLRERWGIRTVNLMFDTRPGTAGYGPVHIDANFSGLLVDGLADGLVTVDIHEQGVEVKGSLIATSTLITLGPVPKQTPPVDDYFLDVELDFFTGRGVEFLWPSRDFPILQSSAATGQKLTLHVDGRRNELSLIGDIDIRGGQVNYFDRTFHLREGLLRFNERGVLVDPLLSLRAETRENTGDDLVRIFLVAENSRLSRFSPRFETDSNLSDRDIFALLGQDVLGLGSEGESFDISTAVFMTSDLLAQIGPVRAFERYVRDRFNLDLFSVRTRVFQNLLREAVDQPVYPLDTMVPSLGKYLDKTSIFLGKYLGTDLFLELLLQFQAMSPFERDLRDFSGVRVSPELMLEWKTPFFLLEWSFAPQNPTELYIFDNVLSFNWKHSY